MDFVQLINAALAVSFILRDFLEEPLMKQSAFFHPQFVGGTLQSRNVINRILDKVSKEQKEEYVADVHNLSLMIHNFIKLMFKTSEQGKQKELIKDLEVIAKKYNVKIKFQE